MRARTGVILGAGLLIGGLVFAALIPPDDASQLGGGAAGQAGVVEGTGTPIDDLVEESLRHAHEADAAISDGRLRLDPTTRFDAAGAKSVPVAPDADSAMAVDWQPPIHDLPQGVYFDEKALLLVGPRWIYEYKAVMGGDALGRSILPILVGLVPEASMGHLEGDYFVRWAGGDGWLPSDVAGPQHARRRTRLRRRGAQLCVGARCLQYSAVLSANPAFKIVALANQAVNPFWHRLPASAVHQHRRLGPLTISMRERPLDTGVPRSAVQFSIAWVDAQRVTHVWGTRRPARGDVYKPQPIHHTLHEPLTRRAAPRAAPRNAHAVQTGWPAVSPDKVLCVCVTDDCAYDDRSAHVVAAQTIASSGMPYNSARWRCDRPNPSRRWSLRPLGLKGEAVLETGRRARPGLRLPAPMAPAMGAMGAMPSSLVVRDDNHMPLWHFGAQTDGTLKARQAGATDAVILQPLPTSIR